MSTDVELLDQVAEASRPTAPIPMAPEADQVDLPIGLVTPQGVVTRVQVRELNGYDEEAIARTKNIGEALLTILDRATVRVGDEKATPALLRELFLADRLAILVGISRCTWGSNVVINFMCPLCEHEESLDYNLDDLPVETANPKDAYFEVPLGEGRVARAHWPKGDAHEALLRSDMDNRAIYRTVMINRCVEEVNGLPVMGDSAKSMSVRDRKLIVGELEKVVVGPRFDLTKLNCPSCGKEVSAVLTVGDLFPF